MNEKLPIHDKPQEQCPDDKMKNCEYAKTLIEGINYWRSKAETPAPVEGKSYPDTHLYTLEEAQGIMKKSTPAPVERREMSTEELIAELEKRRKSCDKCDQNIKHLNKIGRCDLCIWREENIRKDNFKPIDTTDRNKREAA